MGKKKVSGKRYTIFSLRKIESGKVETLNLRLGVLIAKVRRRKGEAKRLVLMVEKKSQTEANFHDSNAVELLLKHAGSKGLVPVKI